MQALPAVATPRRPDRRTLGGAVARIADALGQPLMPWQQYAADVAGELLDDGTPAHRLVVLTVPRQSGKTTLLRAVAVTRSLLYRDHRAWYTAQTRAAARDRWADAVLLLDRCRPLRGQTRVRHAQGSESVTFPAVGSTWRVFAPQPDALHGEALDLVTIDEAWSFDDRRGAELLQAAIPAGSTRPHFQLWLVSTAGDADSTWLKGFVDRGRDGDPSVCYLEWSAEAPDLDAVIAAHPAVGHTITADAVAAAAAALPPGEFERAYGNRWTLSAERVFPPSVWQSAQTDARPAPGARVAVAVDVAPDRSTASVCVAWMHEGRATVALAAHGAGVAWIQETAGDLADRWQCPVVYDEGAPAAAVVDRWPPAIRRRGLSFRQAAIAAQQIYDGITAGEVRIVTDPALDAAAAGAATRTAGDAWLWGRRTASADVTPLVAATFAVWELNHEATPPVLHV